MYHRQKCNILTTSTTHKGHTDHHHKGLTGNPNSWTEHSNKKPRNHYSSHWHVTLTTNHEQVGSNVDSYPIIRLSSRWFYKATKEQDGSRSFVLNEEKEWMIGMELDCRAFWCRLNCSGHIYSCTLLVHMHHSTVKHLRHEQVLRSVDPRKISCTLFEKIVHLHPGQRLFHTELFMSFQPRRVRVSSSSSS